MTTNVDDIQPGALLDTGFIAGLLGVNPRTVLNYERKGILPPAINLGPRIKRWRGADILAVLEQEPAR